MEEKAMFSNKIVVINLIMWFFGPANLKFIPYNEKKALLICSDAFYSKLLLEEYAYF